MATPKTNYCPYKEYWFGPGEEAQAKPAGLKFKRGALLQFRESTAVVFNGVETGVELDLPNIFRTKDHDPVFFLVGYDSNLVQRRVTDSLTYKSIYVEAVEHKFTVLSGERMGTITLAAWGEYHKNRHNEMWRKAHKVMKHPAKKQKKRGSGFSFDDG